MLYKGVYVAVRLPECGPAEKQIFFFLHYSYQKLGLDIFTDNLEESVRLFSINKPNSLVYIYQIRYAYLLTQKVLAKKNILLHDIFIERRHLTIKQWEAMLLLDTINHTEFKIPNFKRRKQFFVVLGQLFPHNLNSTTRSKVLPYFGWFGWFGFFVWYV